MKKYQVKERYSDKIIYTSTSKLKADIFKDIYTVLIQTEPFKGKGLQWVYLYQKP